MRTITINIPDDCTVISLGKNESDYKDGCFDGFDVIQDFYVKDLDTYQGEPKTACGRTLQETLEFIDQHTINSCYGKGYISYLQHTMDCVADFDKLINLLTYGRLKEFKCVEPESEYVPWTNDTAPNCFYDSNGVFWQRLGRAHVVEFIHIKGSHIIDCIDSQQAFNDYIQKDGKPCGALKY